MRRATWWMGALLWLVSAAAWAHKSSDAYLQLDAGESELAVRWDIALRDLDAALDLDADGDGALSWREVRSAWPRIDAYALPRLQVESCPLHVVGHALEKRADGSYAVLRMQSSCVLRAAPAMRYSLLREVDPTHRGIARIRVGSQADEVRLLDPGLGGSQAAGGSPGPVAKSSVSSSGTAFVREGVHHILSGYDHVLFLLCLLLPAVMRREASGRWVPVVRFRQALLPIFGVVTSFTLAHSVTLGLAASGVFTLPSAFIEPAIAATIVLAAIDNIWPILRLPRAAVAFSFGLIHGFGFAGVLAELELPARQFAWALLQFNLGLELGQLLIVMTAMAVLFLLRRWTDYRRWVIGAGSWAAASVGSVWLVERAAGVSWMPF